MPFEGVRVQGYREASRAFAKMDAELKAELTGGLKEAGEPVRAEAETLAVSNIRNIGDRWSRMRLGVTTSVVYVAPSARNRGGSPRPNLAGLLMDKAMSPALQAKEPEVVALLDAMLGRLAGEAGL